MDVLKRMEKRAGWLEELSEEQATVIVGGDGIVRTALVYGLAFAALAVTALAADIQSRIDWDGLR